MRCPECQNDATKVIDSRQVENGGAIRRRRVCENCHHRYTTYERIETKALVVIKKDGRRENFEPSKIYNGILQSAEKRPVTSDQIKDLVKHVEINLRNSSSGEVTSDEVGSRVLEALSELDPITYFRFASVYKRFNELSEVEELLRQFRQKGDESETD
ncbi:MULTISPECIES: transcriptional regulator NrdR [unclassified Streptococcus]|uniref:transcriptional regulator NrdR n=1 Tax=unclassified Streptococcus TaxID=2608887 RepID=UPI0018A897DF|nr:MULTISPECIES: transcriptional regulator NrdR [unclassified Streptococcus]MBF8970078.1 transcriptional repressor NrdR [Streptococcus sp. NLN76]MBG9367494.1 transcriptional repressor NrdR [Streptococcus sp. NLN64]MBJ6746238.1 transcriptional repressor NrdR [Streptococcus sp. 121]